ncbi:MAG: hypothetical protein DWP92_09675 [Armatimonadetes bacterium]|nr:MAG: hypothetical protein DWP92_09675 [Armatimonadota bacterium]
MTGLRAQTTWWSRLADETLSDDLGFTPHPSLEIPHIRGIPVPIPLAEDQRAVREWPNLAGRLEPLQAGHVVRWDRRLAPEPHSQEVLARGEATDVALLEEMQPWFDRFIRSLEQIRRVIRAAPSETPRAILLTPRNPVGDLPSGVEAVPRRLGEFPGGIQITLGPDSWQQRDAYADDVRGWLTDHASQH